MNIYEYDSKKLQFKQIKKTKLLLKPILITILVTFIIINSLYIIFNTPEEIVLKKEKQTLIYNYNYLNKKIDSSIIELIKLKEKEHNIYNNILLNKYNKNQGGIDINITDTNNIYDLINNKNNELISNTKLLDTNYNSLFKLLYLETNIPSILPFNPTDSINIVSDFGFRLHPILNEIKFHTGVDFDLKLNDSVYTTAHGIIELIEYNDTGYGNQIVVNHLFYKTRYAHLDTILVNVNDKVYRGQLIGLVGNTGLSTGPHLHYEVMDDNYKQLNPSQFYSFNNNKSNKILLDILKIN